MAIDGLDCRLVCIGPSSIHQRLRDPPRTHPSSSPPRHRKPPPPGLAQWPSRKAGIQESPNRIRGLQRSDRYAVGYRYAANHLAPARHAPFVIAVRYPNTSYRVDAGRPSSGVQATGLADHAHLGGWPRQEESVAVNLREAPGARLSEGRAGPNAVRDRCGKLRSGSCA